MVLVPKVAFDLLLASSFAAKAVCVADDIGLLASVVLSTLPKPTAVLSKVCHDLSPL